MAILRRKIDGAGDMQSVVRTMKAVAASSINQFENAVKSLAEYDHTVAQGLGAYLMTYGTTLSPSIREGRSETGRVGAVVFGSEQGLVGPFNEVVAGFADEKLSSLTDAPAIWAVGRRVHACLAGKGLPLAGLFCVPSSVKAITPLIGQILAECAEGRLRPAVTELHIYYNRPAPGTAYRPVGQRLLPLDKRWLRERATPTWLTSNLPEVIGDGVAVLRALIREYLFVTLYRACAESLAAENSSRLVAMQRADKNIDERLDQLRRRFHRLRQSTIDEELFDVISGFNALSNE